MRATERSTERKLFTCKSGTSLTKTTAKSRRKKREATRKFMVRFNKNRHGGVRSTRWWR